MPVITSYVFQGSQSRRYDFFLRGVDNVGNREPSEELTPKPAYLWAMCLVILP